MLRKGNTLDSASQWFVCQSFKKDTNTHTPSPSTFVSVCVCVLHCTSLLTSPLSNPLRLVWFSLPSCVVLWLRRQSSTGVLVCFDSVSRESLPPRCRNWWWGSCLPFAPEILTVNKVSLHSSSFSVPVLGAAEAGRGSEQRGEEGQSGFLINKFSVDPLHTEASQGFF